MPTVRTVAWVVLSLAVLPSIHRAAAGPLNSNDFDGSAWRIYATGQDNSSFTSTVSSIFNGPVLSAGNTSVQVSAPPQPAPPPASVGSISSRSTTASDFTQSSPGNSGNGADALINFGTSSLPEVSQLTVGTPQPWFNSPAVIKAFGGSAPNASQQAAFTNNVLADVKHTFQLSGVDASFTINPADKATHTLSVVSGVSYAPNPNAIGITDVGMNGVGLIDKLGYADDPQSLASAVAHNVSHELMHAFGVAIHHDQTGQYLDAATANWSMLTSASTTFSQAAADEMAAMLKMAHLNPSNQLLGNTQILRTGAEVYEMQLGPQPVPEPTTVAAWTLVLGAVAYQRRKRAAA